jgi:hypothetical protein
MECCSAAVSLHVEQAVAGDDQQKPARLTRSEAVQKHDLGRG